MSFTGKLGCKPATAAHSTQQEEDVVKVCSFSQEKRRKGDNEVRENHISPFRMPLTQLNNCPARLDGEKHVSLVESCQILSVNAVIVTISLI